MCGIIGIFNSNKIRTQLKQGMQEMKHRGRDGSGTFIKENNGIGHVLHAIVSKVKQPLNSKLVANCEIYNWQSHGIKARNDAEMILRLLEKEGITGIEKLDGVFALAYWNENKIYLARDIIGIKPIWYSHSDTFAFASEKKVLEKLGFVDVIELNPRKILVYDIKTNEIDFIEREFFKLKEIKKRKQEIKKELKKKLLSALEKRIPTKKVGVLFSGGIDSTIIAYLLKKWKVDFTCYTAVLDEKGMTKAEDLDWAEKIAKKYKFKLKTRKIGIKEVEKYIKKIVPLIEDSNVVKVGVALPFYLACEQAKKDGVKVIFSGLGSEEIFAGYERHEKSSNINEECIYGLKQMYQRDLYRDDVVTMYHSIELRVPFLDKELVNYATSIPEKYKIVKGIKKHILREVALELGLEKEFAMRKKKAAQYGSKFDKAIGKLAKKEGKKKSEYLRKFYPSHNLRIGALFSSGKDSTYAVHIMQKMNYEISCLITIKSENKDSYMFHTPNIEMVNLQAEAMNIPLVSVNTKGEKEKELEDLKIILKEAKEKYQIDGIITGALFSNYQRERIEKVADSLSLKIFSPLWHMNQETEVREIINKDFKFIITKVAADGLEKSWLNKIITEDHLQKLIQLNEKIGFNIAGEGGEFESLMIDGPIFNKKIQIEDFEIEEDGIVATLIIKKAKLV